MLINTIRNVNNYAKFKFKYFSFRWGFNVYSISNQQFELLIEIRLLSLKYLIFKNIHFNETHSKGRSLDSFII